ncbi:alpha/beta fold hydrolase [Paratractidigestivibacter sp.]|uniref:alpha/beta fold hydrolase n=1 Tax=Paratractidigestivibacter sp. TaxID=2847316 RepID=UPI002ACB0F07|nr:alpha/beta fold hydrolase [Paratractidigestivibacter sp.]
MSVTPPPVHVPRPYARPTANLVARVDVPTEDGASMAAFVYAPHGVRDVPGTPFGIDSAFPPVLMLHGNGEEHGIFGPVIDAVVATERSVVAIDSRAQGESTRGEAPLTYELMAADAREVMSRLGVWDCHVLGFSDGAILGLLLARDWGEHVLSVTASGANLTPAGLPQEDTDFMAEAAAANAAWAAEGWEGEVDEEGNAVPSPAEAARIAELLQLMVDQPQIDAASLGGISCPVTVMAGEFDCILPEETERIAEAIGGAQTYIVPEAGHTIPKEAPEVMSKVLLETIGQNDARHPTHEVNAPSDVLVVPIDDSWADAVEDLYAHVCAEPGTSGWAQGLWPPEGLAAELLCAGKTLAALDPATAEVLGAVSVDFDDDMGDGWLAGHGRGQGGPDWEPRPTGEVACYHLLAVDPAARGRHVARALLAAAGQRARDLGASVVRINTSVANVGANNLYAGAGLTRHKPIWLPYEGLDLPGYTNLWELAL